MLAVGDRDLAPDVAISCIGTARGLETRVIPAAGLTLELVPPVPLPRRLTPELLKVPGRLAGSVREARRIIRDAGADVVAGFGGYVSMPAYLAARSMGIPVVIHEQNAVPGLANKVAARFAAVVAVTFPGTPLPKARFLGMPLRRGTAGQFRIQPCDWLPEALVLPARVAAADAGSRTLWLHFDPLTPGLTQALERHLFRVHRREIAGRRQRG